MSDRTRYQENVDEQSLLTRIREGDASVYPYLHDAYYTPLVYYSLSIIKDRQQAEDIAMECLVKLWQVPARFESEGKLRGYLFTLTRNASLNYLKHLQKKEKGHKWLSGEQEVTAPELEAILVEADLMRLIYQEIERLPAAYGEVVKLLYLENLSSADAAERLGITMDNLRQRKGRALATLRSALIRIGISELILSVLFFK